MSARAPRPPAAGLSLEDDCARCVGLCCVALAFSRSADFALDKRAGDPCPHLDTAFRCRVHEQLPQLGFAGCVTFSCYGAGPRLTQEFGGGDWRTDRDRASSVFAAFPLVRQLLELLWHVRAALATSLSADLRDALARVGAELESIASTAPESIDPDGVGRVRERTTSLLRTASTQLRGPRPGRDLAAADLVGADLRRADLVRASLRGALLLGADLRGARLDHTDLTGADLRQARLDGADLATTLFVTPAQLRSARGSVETILPEGLDRPAGWLER